MRERLKRVVMKTTGGHFNQSARINHRQSADCSRTVVAGEVAERLMAPVLKTGIP
jgi:hypothetical protein